MVWSMIFSSASVALINRSPFSALKGRMISGVCPMPRIGPGKVTRPLQYFRGAHASGPPCSAVLTAHR